MAETGSFDPTLTTCGAAKILAEVANAGPRKRCSMIRSYFTYQYVKKPITTSDAERKPSRAKRTMGSWEKKAVPAAASSTLATAASRRDFQLNCHADTAVHPPHKSKLQSEIHFRAKVRLVLILNHKAVPTTIWMRVKG